VTINPPKKPNIPVQIGAFRLDPRQTGAEQMSNRQLRFGAILQGVGMTQDGWKQPGVPNDASINIDWYRANARLAEQAKFDFVFIVDSPYITPDSAPHFLNRLEPLTLLSAVAGATSRIGLVATLTTSYNEPFNVARAFASLDLISDGRAGWNVVTTGLEGAAGNYGRDEHIPHAVRYRRAKEHLSVVRALWDSYEGDAFARSKSGRDFLDKKKQHALNHRGEFFSVAGPLNISRSKQGHPVIFQAGGSEDGKDLAATSADAIFTGQESFEEAQAFYADVKARAVAAGRSPDSILIFPGIGVTVAPSDEEANAIVLARNAKLDLKKALAQLGRPFNYHDFSQYPLDGPFPELGDLGENGYRSHAERIKRVAREEGLTVRQAALRFSARSSAFVGSPTTIANELERWFREGAADGFNIGVGEPSELQAFIDHVVPVLQARGLFRKDYESDTLRGNLGLEIPVNRYTAARQPAPDPAVPAAAKRESLHQIFRDLHAERLATMKPELLQINVNQRKTLVETADRGRFVKTGDRLRSFELPEVDGGTVSLHGLLERGSAVLIFFRFEGCPACNLALSYYQRNLAPGLLDLGATLVAVSPQVPEKLRAIKERHALSYAVASDLGNALGRELGILYTFDEASQKSSLASGRPIGEVTGTGTWELPMPTVLVVSRDRVVRFADVHPDWLVRTEAEPILEAIAALSLATNARQKPQALSA
jgi:FMN-dependent oxidoreductase (nitrilotriacetate monooxygenase family)